MAEEIALPHDELAEQNVLGAMMQSRDAVVDVLEVFKNPETFYSVAHQSIFSAIIKIYSAHGDIDVAVVKSELDNSSQLDQIGGVGYLIDLVNNTPLASAASQYAKIVLSAKLRRNLIIAGREIEALGNTKDGSEIESLTDQAETIIFEASKKDTVEEFSHINELVSDAIGYLDELAMSGGISGVPSPYKDVDDVLHGFKPGQFVIIGGRPSMGKSTMLLDIARNAAFKHDIPTAFFSLEDEPMLLTEKIISAEASIPKYFLETDMKEQNRARVLAVQKKLQDKPLYIDGSSHLSLLEIRTRCRRVSQMFQKNGRKLELIVVDYLQLIHSSAKFENRQIEVAEISRSLKSLAKELHVPVIAGAQLSRAAIDNKNRPPVMSELRESGAIEQDADVILLIHRKFTEENNYENQTDLIIEKNRAGQRGRSVNLLFDGNLSKFSDLIVDKNVAEGNL